MRLTILLAAAAIALPAAVSVAKPSAQGITELSAAKAKKKPAKKKEENLKAAPSVPPSTNGKSTY